MHQTALLTETIAAKRRAAGARVVVTVGERQEAVLQTSMTYDVDAEDGGQDEDDDETGHDDADHRAGRHAVVVTAAAAVIVHARRNRRQLACDNTVQAAFSDSAQNSQGTCT